jgi:hypothetical protein
VLKNIRRVIESAISRRVTIAAIGNPLPMPFDMTTTSGTTPCASKPQKCAPVRPKPVCTSSTTSRPPAARTRAAAPARYPAGISTMPP